MTLRDLPVVGRLPDVGANDSIFDGLLLAGPAVILVVAVLGRSSVTVALAVGYLTVFVGHVLANALRR